MARAATCSTRPSRVCTTSTTSTRGCRIASSATGRVTPELADRLGLCGLAGRASAQAWDLRAQFPPVPYDALDVRMATHRNGDVAARVDGALRRGDRVATPLPADPGAVAGRRDLHGVAQSPRQRDWRRLGGRLARRGPGRAGNGSGQRASAACTRMIRRGRTGRCSSTR